MKLPRGEKAIIEAEKLSAYVLNSEHPQGKHKARVFEAVLGIGIGETRVLMRALQQAAREEEAVQGRADEFGKRYQIDFEMEYKGRRGIIRSAWLVPGELESPRFVTCFVLLGRKAL